MEEQSILITGGAGFIGSNLANSLSTDNDVVVVDDCFLGDPANLVDSVEFYERSVLESDLPTDVDVVFHLAALSSYQMHEEQPLRGTRVNVEGFVNVCKQAYADGCDTIVYASTSSIYGSRTEPTPETMPVTANTGYEASKLARERYAQYLSRHYDMNLAGLRYFSVYQGYGEAEAHKGNYANVIAQFADDIAKNNAPKLYGDGSQTRDFTHINDIVDGTILAAEHQLDGIFNIGTAERYSFNEVVERLNQELDSDIDPKYVENPIPEDVYVYDTCADWSKIHEATGWTPEISPDDGIRRVCQQYRA